MKNTKKSISFYIQLKTLSTVRLLASTLIIFCSMSSAGTGTIIGPTPYFSTADSPFPLSEPGFFLEDFKDNTYSVGWSTDGKWFRCTASTCTTDSVGIGNTDSVDNDDGTIDGSGSEGASFCIGPVCNNTALSVSFLFDPLALGGYPTHVGIVWTDGGFHSTRNFRSENFQIQFDWYDSTGTMLDSITISSPGDNNFKGQTAEDFFIGMEHSAGFSRLRITGIGDLNYLELDHLQYGFGPTSSSNPLFSFPLKCADKVCKSPYTQGAYTTERVTSVLDHQMNIPYDKDGKVWAFNGEKGEGPIPSNPAPCYPKVGGGSFSVSGLYVGTGDGCLADQGINYDNHPGYDYKAGLGTPVYAAASGTILIDKCLPIGISSCDAWGYVGIDHGNGYVTQYGHLSQISVVPGAIVAEGEEIGLSGDKGIEGSPHLHFEVLKKNDDKPFGYAFVDPYGWEGAENDPLAQINGIENVRLWKYDPKECLLNWAELSFDQLFSPGGTSTEILHPFSYRYYQITNSYLGVSSVDNHVYYVGPDRVLQNAGDLSHWLSVAGCHI